MFFRPDGTEITPGNLLLGTNGGVDLRKPDITAADCVTTLTPGFTTFCGTSASAAHAAAIAALLVHGAFDFNLRIPSNLLLFATLVGLVVAPPAPAAVREGSSLRAWPARASWPRGRPRRVRTPRPRRLRN